MVVKEDGTKWACQSCLKGHRVSGCTHTDRELTLVPKKGRPVTQCHHCRLERKKRSAHIKCDCGEADKPHHPKEKCIHLREAEERAKAGFHDEHAAEKDHSHLAAVAEEQGCCCSHGGKCSCAYLKKDQDKFKDDTIPHGPAVQKPRLESTRSDGQLTVFANGHHKPVHRKNHAAHECGMPYKLPMPRAHTDQNISTAARRSVDSLALDTTVQTNPPRSASQANIAAPAGQRLSKSEHPSPKTSAVDFNTLGPVRTNQSIDSAASDLMPFPQLDPMSAAADSSYDPWSNFPSADATAYPDNNFFGPWATTYDAGGLAQPALTVASSGTQSEIDEIPPMDDLYGFAMPSIQEDAGSLTADGDSGNINRRSLPPNFFKNTDFNLLPVDGDWQNQFSSDFSGEDTHQQKATAQSQMFATNDWTTSGLPTGNAPLRTSNGFAMGRPQSQSVGPGHAPSDDIMKQLFPEMDYNENFGQDNSFLGMDASRIDGLPASNATPGGSDFTGAVDDTNFSTQMWADGSVSVPSDAFPASYDLNQEFAEPDFSTDWQQ